MHFVTGGVGFLALIVACFVYARRFGALKQTRWAVYSMIMGIVFFAAFFGIATGTQLGGNVLVIVTLTFTAAVVNAWVWLSAIFLQLIAMHELTMFYYRLVAPKISNAKQSTSLGFSFLGRLIVEIFAPSHMI